MLGLVLALLWFIFSLSLLRSFVITSPFPAKRENGGKKRAANSAYHLLVPARLVKGNSSKSSGKTRVRI